MRQDCLFPYLAAILNDQGSKALIVGGGLEHVIYCFEPAPIRMWLHWFATPRRIRAG